jgi:hypothetical protein
MKTKSRKAKRTPKKSEAVRIEKSILVFVYWFMIDASVPMPLPATRTQFFFVSFTEATSDRLTIPVIRGVASKSSLCYLTPFDYRMKMVVHFLKTKFLTEKIIAKRKAKIKKPSIKTWPKSIVLER